MGRICWINVFKT